MKDSLCPIVHQVSVFMQLTQSQLNTALCVLFNQKKMQLCSHTGLIYMASWSRASCSAINRRRIKQVIGSDIQKMGYFSQKPGEGTKSWVCFRRRRILLLRKKLFFSSWGLIATHWYFSIPGRIPSHSAKLLLQPDLVAALGALQ